MVDATDTTKRSESLPAWKIVFRVFAKRLSLDALQSLQDALERDDPRLIQGATTTPPPIMAVQNFPCEAGCLVSYAHWQGDGLTTVGEVEEAFARACYEMDQELGEPAACRWLINWVDDTPRDEMRRELLPEVKLAITAKGGGEI